MLPRISIVTPSYNQGAYLDETIRSVLDQGYPNLEYLVLDGGSTDNSVDIIRRHEDRIDYWVSEPDGGQYDAISRGLQRSTGEIMAWINSDDKYMPWAFSTIADIFVRFPEIEWLTSAHPTHWNVKGQVIRCGSREGYSREAFRRGANLPGCGWYAPAWIQQESTFWRRSLWERAGGYVDSSFRFAGDFDLWARFFEHAELCVVSSALGGFRKHSLQKTAIHQEKYLTEAKRILRRYHGNIYGPWESKLRYYANRIIGTRNVASLPVQFRYLLSRLRILYSVKRCVWFDDSWKVVTHYII